MYEDSHLESVYEDAYAGTGYDGYEDDDEPEWYCANCDCAQPATTYDQVAECYVCPECGHELEA